MADDKDKKIQAAALAAFAEEFEGLAVAPDHKRFVDGDYPCKFVAGKSGLNTAGTGRVGFKVVFEVVDGEYQGRRLYHDLWIQSDDQEAKKIAKRDLLKLGLTPADLSTPPNIDSQFLVTVEVKKETKDVRVLKFDPIVN